MGRHLELHSSSAGDELFIIAMLPLAATALETLKNLPPSTWLKIAAVLVGFVVIVILLKKIMGMNKVILGVLSFVVLTIVGFSWVYERNEPAFMTPLVDRIAPFFPSKGSYGDKQGTTPRP
jgi:drug/metabolite transporter (DMT)-like permease